jgi:hypothetical protein
VQLDSVCSFPVEELLLTHLLFRPDGHHIAIGHHSLTLYEVLSGKPVRTFSFGRFVAWCGFSADGRYLAAVNVGDHRPQTDGLARVYEVDSGQLVFEARPRFPVQAACFRGQREDTVFLFRDTLPAPGDGLPGRRERIRGVRLPSLEPDCDLELPGWRVRQVAVGAGLALLGQDEASTCYEVEGASLSYRRYKVAACSYPVGNSRRVRNLGFGVGQTCLSADGRWLALEGPDFPAGQRQLILVNIEAGTAAVLLALPAEVIPAFCFSLDGGHLLSLSEDPEGGGNRLQLWDTSTGRQVAHTTLGLQYQAVALNWPTRRIAALGGGKCDIGLIAA